MAKSRDRVFIFLSLQGLVRFTKNGGRRPQGKVIINQNRRGRLDNVLTKQQTDNQALSIVHIVIINWEQQRKLLFKHGGLKANIAYGALPMASRLTRRYHLHS